MTWAKRRRVPTSKVIDMRSTDSRMTDGTQRALRTLTKHSVKAIHAGSHPSDDNPLDRVKDCAIALCASQNIFESSTRYKRKPWEEVRRRNILISQCTLRRPFRFAMARFLPSARSVHDSVTKIPWSHTIGGNLRALALKLREQMLMWKKMDKN